MNYPDTAIYTSLYQLSGNVKDINRVVITVEELRALLDKDRAEQATNANPCSKAHGAVELGFASKPEVTPTKEDLKQLHSFFFQIIHGDFLADNPKDLSEALKASATAHTLIATFSSPEVTRYRWLRGEAERDYVEFGDAWHESAEDLDAAIDRAIAAAPTTSKEAL